MNEYDPGRKFYRLFTAEEHLRGIATLSPNCYVIGLFACCRQLYDENTMENLVLAPNTTIQAAA